MDPAVAAHCHSCEFFYIFVFLNIALNLNMTCWNITVPIPKSILREFAARSMEGPGGVPVPGWRERNATFRIALPSPGMRAGPSSQAIHRSELPVGGPPRQGLGENLATL